MKIEVKAKHIRRGLRGDPKHCPIALAVDELLGITNVYVENQEIYLGKTRIYLPLVAQNFIEIFDEKKSLAKPFEFEI